MAEVLDQPHMFVGIVGADLNAMGPAVGEQILVLSPRVDEPAAAVKDHQRVLVEPALLAHLLADTFQQPERAPLDIAPCRHRAHGRLLAAHEDEHAILRLGPDSRDRAPGPSVLMHGQRPVLDITVRPGNLSAALLLRDETGTSRHRRSQSGSDHRHQDPG